ncbi:tetratricopeptide repeat protein [Risungbinella massiliensis]|uniref:tetratricopeptide repeat protein n=1 Tax=Risungbinella massiliensis TaxID=1329796 RepID=UPI0005CBDC71|nr:tetratricopeptide repeat protein [Risungbinella massiliensis]
MREKLELLLKAGDQGDIDAYYQYGSLVVNGETPLPQYRGDTYLEKAAKAGHLEAKFAWGMRYIKYRNHSKQAKKWLVESAEAGFEKAAYTLGKFILDKKIQNESIETGIEWLEKAAELGSDEAMLLLGQYYGKKNEPEAIQQSEQWYQQAGENGNLAAILYLGMAYMTGKPFGQDGEKGAAWYELAVKQNSLQAMLELSDFLIKGEAISRNLERGEQLLLKASEFNGYGSVYDYAKRAKYQMAQYYLKGDIFPKDRQKGISWLQQAANARHYEAMYEYGVLLFDGLEVTRDVERARNLFQNASYYARGELRSKIMWKLGLSLLEPPKPGNGRYYLEQAANAGHVKAMRDLGYYLMDGTWINQDLVKGEEWLQKAADLGDESALSNLAYFYLLGKTHVVDKEKGLRLLQEGAEAGNGAVLNHYGWRLVSGSHVVKDVSKGIEYLRRSVEKGYSYAAANLGDYLVCGSYGVQKDPVEGERLLRLSIEQGNAYGMYCLAYEILNGRVRSNVSEAEELLVRAANLGEDRAMVELGKRYRDGDKGLAQNHSKALYYFHLASEYKNSDGMNLYKQFQERASTRWIRIAADQGNVEAQYELGMRYAFGIGVYKSIYEAKKWLRLAANQENTDAAELLAKLN